MKRLMWGLFLVGAVLLCSVPVLAQEGFYVVAGGGPPVGTKITSLPYTISNPGFYYLTGNLTYSGTGNGITVASDDVTFDLMGFRILGPGSNGSNIAINLYDGTNGHRNVEVRNGTISGWWAGLTDWSSVALRNRALNLRVENCLYGIDFETSGDLVKNCTVEAVTTGINIYGGVATGNTVTNCTYGIAGNGTINGNVVVNCSTYGIDCLGASSIIGNTVITTATSQTGIYVNTSNPVLVTQNTVSGVGTHFVGGGATVNVANTNAGF